MPPGKPGFAVPSFRSLTEGVKELMMHRERREAFPLGSTWRNTALSLRHLNLVATKQYAIADGWTQVLFYA
jgi:putative ATP-binding cassette transporter